MTSVCICVQFRIIDSPMCLLTLATNQVDRYNSEIGIHWCRSMLLTLATIAAGITRWKVQQYDRDTLVQVNVTYPGYNCGRLNQVEGTTV